MTNAQARMISAAIIVAAGCSLPPDTGLGPLVALIALILWAIEWLMSWKR